MDLWSKRLLFGGSSEKDFVFFEETLTGYYSLNVIRNGYYEIIAVGGAGRTVFGSAGRYSNWYGAGASGGSGSFVKGLFLLKTGDVLNVTVGSSESYYRGIGNATNLTIDSVAGIPSTVSLSGEMLVNAGAGTGGSLYMTWTSPVGASVQAGLGGTGECSISSIETTITNGNNGYANSSGWNLSFPIYKADSVYENKGSSVSGSINGGSSFSISEESTPAYVKIIFKGSLK